MFNCVFFIDYIYIYLYTADTGLALPDILFDTKLWPLVYMHYCVNVCNINSDI